MALPQYYIIGGFQALAHLHGTNNRLAHSVAAANHHLLSQEHLLDRHLDAQVATGDHDAIASLHDLVKPVQTWRYSLCESH